MLHKPSLICLLVALIVVESSNGQQRPCNLQKTKPKPTIYKYAYQDCMLVQFAGYFTNKAYNMYLPIENGYVSSDGSSCNMGAGQFLVVDFNCGDIRFYFKQNSLNKTFVYYISGTLNYGNSSLVFSNNTPIFNTAPGHYYKCDAEQTLSLDAASLTLENVAIEAFRSGPGIDFSKIPDECYMDSQSVGSVVGVCLLALAVISIIACFVWYHRGGRT